MEKPNPDLEFELALSNPDALEQRLSSLEQTRNMMGGVLFILGFAGIALFLLNMVGSDRDSPGGIFVLLIAIGYLLLSIKKSLVQNEIRTLKAYRKLQSVQSSR
jgi:UDP-N-acetylmuramyl pentapeptide phosphotransferase/UDP-N-acetylglucosamine-1-phosphate transferase